MSELTLVDRLLALCEIPSPTGGERLLCDKLAEELEGVALAAPIRRYGDSLVVPLTRGTGGPRVALAGHLNVVSTSHDAPPHVEGDRLYGPGASDMKSGLTLMLDLALASEGRIDFEGVDLTLVFYAREEGPFRDNELGPVLDADSELRGVELAVCLEPSDNKISLGASGTLHAELTFEGQTAHSARPWQGENAIHKAGPFLSEMSAIHPREVTIDGFLFRTVTSVTMARGGRGKNVIPNAFTLNLNHRFSPDTSIEQAQRDVEALVASRARIEWMDLSPSAPPFASHPLVVALHNAGALGMEPKQAWTDVARFALFGVPAINFGPGENAQAHQRNEWTSIPKLIEGDRILRRWLRAIGRT